MYSRGVAEQGVYLLMSSSILAVKGMVMFCKALVVQGLYMEMISCVMAMKWMGVMM